MDVGDEAAILLLLGSSGESAFIQMRVEMNRAVVSVSLHLCVTPQGAECLQNFEEWIRWFQTTGINVENFSTTAAAASRFHVI